MICVYVFVFIGNFVVGFDVLGVVLVFIDGILLGDVVEVSLVE